jgi:Mu transposase-like protein
LIEFRDGVHGALVWAIAVVVTGLIIAASATQLTSKAAEQANSPATTTGEPLLAYELDRLFRAEKRPADAELTYIRAEAGRILLASAGRQGITSADRVYLAQLVAGRTGIAQPEAERRVDEAVTAANVAVQKARRSAVILGVDGNTYSVPWRLIGESVRVVIAGDQLRISHAGREVAVHQRRTGRFQCVVDPLHFAGVVGSNPRTPARIDCFRHPRLTRAAAAAARI